MNSKELRGMDVAALQEKLDESRKELFTLRFKHATAQLENTQSIPAVKKGIARILTVLREKEMGA